MSAFIDDLTTAMPDGALVTDPDRVESYRHDRTSWLEPGYPAAVAFPRTTEHVSTAVRIAAAHGVPIVPRGAGSSLAGGAQAIDGCLVLCTERMTRILDVDRDNLTIMVQPGVLNADVTHHVADDGLWFPPDPASKAFCTIGGNVATNAGGLCCVKYGVTRDYVLGLEVVLADGTVMETGRQTVKGVAGLDLTGLFVGSEGTLGVVTKIRLKLRTTPQPASTLVAFFPTLGAAGHAVTELIRSGVPLSLMEILDRTTLRAVEEWRHMDLDTDAAALLLVQSDAPLAARSGEIERTGQICDRAGATFTALTDDPHEGEALLEARRIAYSAFERQGATLLDDVAVPRSEIPGLLERTEKIADRHAVTIGVFGHAGDGNMHPTLVVPHGDDEARETAFVAFGEIVDAALDLGGTITGEHGIGALKGRWLEREVGGANLATQRAIKRTLDPQNLLNPGRWL